MKKSKIIYARGKENARINSIFLQVQDAILEGWRLKGECPASLKYLDSWVELEMDMTPEEEAEYSASHTKEFTEDEEPEAEDESVQDECVNEEVVTSKSIRDELIAKLNTLSKKAELVDFAKVNSIEIPEDMKNVHQIHHHIKRTIESLT